MSELSLHLSLVSIRAAVLMVWLLKPRPSLKVTGWVLLVVKERAMRDFLACERATIVVSRRQGLGGTVLP